MIPSSRRTRALQRGLLEWYSATGRGLPWRQTSDPYAILVSEFMLQQTQAGRVELAWPAFLERFPTVGSLAAAPVSEVVAAWRGLGYNRRAVRLQRAAQGIVARHGGEVPADPESLEALPGIGPYTARAVAVFAFGAAVAPVDVNVGRVLARAVAGHPLDRARVQTLADSLAAEAARTPAGPAAWSHALMDLGARRCTARAPQCGRCPVAAHCTWRRRANAERDPAASGALRPRPQGRFDGSDRYHRGRLVDALRDRDLDRAEIAEAARLTSDATRLDRIVEALIADGLATWRDGRLTLPGASGGPGGVGHRGAAGGAGYERDV